MNGLCPGVRGRAVVALILALGVGATLARAEEAENPLLCVLVPHFKDEYWLSVGYGLEYEAAAQGVTLRFHEAGGYRARSRQIEQLNACAESGADAVLIGAVSDDDPALVQAVADTARRVPVFGLVNALEADGLSGRVGVDWAMMGRAIGRDLARRHPAGSPRRKAVLVSGPEQSGWAERLETGLRAELDRSAVDLIEVLGADTGLRPQLALVERALSRHPDIDYLIGSAPAIEAAIGLAAQTEIPQRPLLIATYISHTVRRGLMNGTVLSVPFDDPQKQGRMAIRQAMQVLASGRKAGLAGPRIDLLHRGDAGLAALDLSPASYFPSIQ